MPGTIPAPLMVASTLVIWSRCNVLHASESLATYSKPVLDGLKIPDGLGNSSRIATHHRADADGSQHILDVVASLERLELQMISRWPLASRKRMAIADVRALLHLFLAAEPEDLRPRAAGECSAGGVVTDSHRKSLLAAGSGKISASGVGVVLERCGDGRDGRAMKLSTTATFGRVVWIISNWKLDTSRTTTVSGFACSTREIAGVPMLPPTAVEKPPAAIISPARVVVVVFPFDPVIANNFSIENCARQFNLATITGSPRAHGPAPGVANPRARRDCLTIRSCPWKVRSPWPPGLDRDAVVEQHRNLISPSWSCGFESGAVTFARRACRKKRTPRPTPRPDHEKRVD